MRVVDLLPPAFSKPRFRIYAMGQAVSIVGSWVQQIALSWLVYRLTRSVFLLGLTGFILQIPHLFFAPIAGVLGDRLPRVRLLVAINIILALLAATMAALALSGVTDIRVYLCLAGLFGVTQAFEAPVRQALILTIVEDRALLTSAIAMNSVFFNGGRIVGPAVAGWMLLFVSEGWCFAINAASYVAIIAALLAMRLPDPWPQPGQSKGLAGVVEGAAHLMTLPAARYMLPVVVAVALFGVSYQHLMPSLAVEFYGGSSATVGLLMTAAGIGAFTSATIMSFQRGHRLQFMFARFAPLLLGLAVIGLAFSHALALSMACLVVIGASILATSASTNTLLQQSVDDAWRARIIGFYLMAFLGSSPIGHLLAGTTASYIGLTATLAINGALVFLIGAAMQLRLLLQPERLAELEQSLRLKTQPG